MKTLAFVFLAAVSAMSVGLSLGRASSTLLDAVSEENAPASVADLGFRYGDRFVEPRMVSPADPLVSLFGPGVSIDGTVFLGRASYHINKAPEALGAPLFENVAILRYLLGPSYSISPISRNPFSFRARRHVSMALFSQDIESDTVMSVYQWSQIPDPGLKRAILTTTGGRAPEQVIWQRASNFNHYIERTFILTLVYPSAPGTSEVELYSGSLLNDREFAAIPEFIESSVIRSIADGDLTGYVRRLSQMR